MPVDILSETPEELAKKVHSRWAVVDGMQALLYDAELAHLVLDEVGVPRVIEPGTRPLSLANRVTYLHAQLVSARKVLQQGEAGSVVYKRARVFRQKVVVR